MNKIATLTQALMLVIIIMSITASVFVVPKINFEKSTVIPVKPSCEIATEKTRFELTEGDNISFKVLLSKLSSGNYTISLNGAPSAILSSESRFTAKDSKEIVFNGFNVTPSINKNQATLAWKGAKIIVDGPSACEFSLEFYLTDNCPLVYNPDQSDIDNDTIGDACDNQICGNSICEAGENSTNCCTDCTCLPGERCNNNTCEGTRFNCVTALDCKDTSGCTRDICYHANTSLSSCGHLEITDCSEDRPDGCCPQNCNANTDIDCEPKCGNNICEDFYEKEDRWSCLGDC